MNPEYEQQLLDTIERQEKCLIKCREWIDMVSGVEETIRNGCIKSQISQEAILDLTSMHNIDMSEYISNYILSRASVIATEEIQKLKDSGVLRGIK